MINDYYISIKHCFSKVTEIVQVMQINEHYTLSKTMTFYCWENLVTCFSPSLREYVIVLSASLQTQSLMFDNAAVLNVFIFVVLKECSSENTSKVLNILLCALFGMQNEMCSSLRNTEKRKKRREKKKEGKKGLPFRV